MHGKTCFFIGHRDAPPTLYAALRTAVEQLIQSDGVQELIVGHYGRFDALAAQAVRAAKTQHPGLRLLLLLPYYSPAQSFPLPEGFDGTFYPPGMEFVPRRAAIVRANRYMIDHTDYLIAFVTHPGSNARKLLDYARRRAKTAPLHIILLQAV